MTSSQSDVDRVMAAFGAAPISYRPNQDTAAPSSGPATISGAAHTNADRQAAPAPSARAADRILPGSGGRVREVFPLLSRAVPVVGDLKVGAVKRPGDEVPETQDQDAGDAGVIVKAMPAPVPPATPASAEPGFAGGNATEAQLPEPDAATREISPAEWTRQTDVVPSPPAAPSAAAPVTAVPAAVVAAAVPAPPASPRSPLRSHADLIKARAPRPTLRSAPAAATPEARAASPMPPLAPKPVAAAPQPLAAPLSLPPAHAAAPVTPGGPPMAHAQSYPPPYYPPQNYPPQAMPPPGAAPYPMHPAALAWAQQGYPPPYPMPPPAYFPGYQPSYAPGYPPPYPYGYPQQHPHGAPPGAFGAPPPYPPYPMPQPEMPPEPHPPAPEQATAAPAPQSEPEPEPAAQPAAQPSLSDIFAALHRAPRNGSEEAS